MRHMDIQVNRKHTRALLRLWEGCRDTLYNGELAAAVFGLLADKRGLLQRICIEDRECDKNADVYDTFLFDLLSNFPCIHTLAFVHTLEQTPQVMDTLRQFAQVYPDRRISIQFEVRREELPQCQTSM